MKAFNELHLQDLHWVESNSWKSKQELQDADGNVMATMTKQSWWSNTYEVDAPGNRWVFKPKGIFRRSIEIYSAGTGDLVSTFEYTGINGKGNLTLPDGRSYIWKQINFWGNKWAWLEGSEKHENPVLGFDTGGLFRAKADLNFDEHADFPALLVFLGWYLHTLSRQQQAATMASTTAAIS